MRVRVEEFVSTVEHKSTAIKAQNIQITSKQ